ncbi:MAG: hypothetical protein WEB52_15185 [Dehalococcoidia bacterium]
MHVWKGDLLGESIIDTRSMTYIPGEPEPIWGGGGSCGAIGEDPTGMFAVLGLHRSGEAYLSPSLPTTFWLRDEPYDVAALSDPSRRHFRLPALGGGNDSSSSHGDLLLFSAIAAAACGAMSLVVLRGMVSGGRG